MSSNSLCHGLFWKIRSVIEIQFKRLLQKKNENSKRTVTRKNKTVTV